MLGLFTDEAWKIELKSKTRFDTMLIIMGEDELKEATAMAR